MFFRHRLQPCFFDILLNHIFILRIYMFNLNMFVHFPLFNFFREEEACYILVFRKDMKAKPHIMFRLTLYVLFVLSRISSVLSFKIIF